MAKEFVLKKRRLEENGIINVSHYFRELFESCVERKFECSNCGNKHTHKHVYKHKNESIINLCYFCNKLINNSSSHNLKFNKM